MKKITRLQVTFLQVILTVSVRNSYGQQKNYISNVNKLTFSVVCDMKKWNMSDCVKKSVYFAIFGNIEKIIIW